MHISAHYHEANNINIEKNWHSKVGLPHSFYCSPFIYVAHHINNEGLFGT
jgi:hypothetical protein